MRKAITMLIAALGLVALMAGPAAAHEVNAPTVSCSQVSASATGFSAGSHTVTFHVTVNAVASTKSATFTGASGTPTASITDLTSATGPLTISAYATWTDDGGGQSETATTSATCHEVPPTTQPPPTTEERPSPPPVESVTPEVPAAAPASPPAAVAVVVVPQLTG